MLGLLITLVFSVGLIGFGRAVLSRFLFRLDPAAAYGLGGMIGLAAIGTLTLFIGLLPGGLRWGVWLVSAFAGYGLAQLYKRRAELRLDRPVSLEWLFVVPLALLSLFALVSVLAPSDLGDWDTLSHHLASVKIWINEGQFAPIRFMHQSNFPFAVDNLFVWGLQWGGEAGAKTFSLVFYLLGIVTVFGLARQLYGRSGAWWSALLFGAVPVIVWESGTAYIDVAHGLFAGLGILFAGLSVQPQRSPLNTEDSTLNAERSMLNAPAAYPWLSAICLGFAAGTKYTGLQTLLAVGVALLLYAAISRRSALAKQAVLVGVVAVAIASPWYIKNVVWNGNPVYPFFHSVFKGPNWDDRRSAIYQNEQRTFGVGREQHTGAPTANIDPTQIGHAIGGLAYLPGRFTNPGQVQGFGDPLSAVGIPVVAVFFLVLLRGRPRPYETVALVAIGISLLMWFVLSQQSRYITSIAPPLAIMAAGLISWPIVGMALRIVIAAQAVWTIYLFKFLDPLDRGSRFDTQLQVVIGKVPLEEYRAQRIPFYTPAQTINQIAQGGKVALYDEVFGYLLNVDYFWANPGHSTIIPYDSMQSGEDFVKGLKKLGFTHVYFSRMSNPQDFLGAPLSEDQRQALMDNWEVKWKALAADAYAKHLIEPLHQFPQGLLFELPAR